MCVTKYEEYRNNFTVLKLDGKLFRFDLRFSDTDTHITIYS